MLKAIIIVSFGTADLRGIKELEKFEEEIKESTRNKYYVCKAFTSKLLSKAVLNKYDKIVPTLEELLVNLNNEGYKEVYIQPLYIIEGKEYLGIKKVVEEYIHYFSKILLGNAFMSKKEDKLKKSFNLIFTVTKKDLSKTDNIVLVGHGSKSADTEIYNTLKEFFVKNGYKNIYVGTLEGKIKKEEVLNQLIKNNIKNLTIIPIFMLQGKHIKRDVFGESNSWESLIKEHNIKVKSIKKSLLEYEEIRKYYINEIKLNLNKESF